MVNLISPARARSLYVLYLTRLAGVALLMLGMTGVVIAVLLLPSYFVIHAEIDQAAEYVAAATQLADERAKGQSQEVLQQFHELVTQLSATSHTSSYAHILELTTQDRPLGLGVSAVQVTYDDAGNATVLLSGTARTRAELIAFSNALKKVPELSAVVVPVSALVADVNAAFTISMQWTRPKKL